MNERMNGMDERRTLSHLYSSFIFFRSTLHFVYGFLVCPTNPQSGSSGTKVLEEMVGRPTHPDIILRFMTRRVQPMGQLSRCVDACMHARVDEMQCDAMRCIGTDAPGHRDKTTTGTGRTQRDDGRDDASVSRSRLSRCGRREVSSHLKVLREEFPNRTETEWISDSPMREASLRLDDDDDDVDDTTVKARRRRYTRGR